MKIYVFIYECESMDMEVGFITKRSNEVEMMCGMEELMNFVH